MRDEDDFTWEDMREIVHSIRDDRVVVKGCILRLKKIDKKLEKIEDKLNTLILRKDE